MALIQSQNGMPTTHPSMVLRGPPGIRTQSHLLRREAQSPVVLESHILLRAETRNRT